MTISTTLQIWRDGDVTVAVTGEYHPEIPGYRKGVKRFADVDEAAYCENIEAMLNGEPIDLTEAEEDEANQRLCEAAEARP